MKKVFFILAVMSLLLLSSCEKTKTSTDLVDFEDLTVNAEGIWIGSDDSGEFTDGNLTFPTNYSNDPSYGESWNGFAYTNHTDVTTAGFLNQYSAIAGSGAELSEQYGVFYSFLSDTIVFAEPEKISNISVCNSSYAYLSMRDGDNFAKKFGGDSGNDEDWYKLTLTGLSETGEMAGTLDIYLADYRFANNDNDYISNVWNDIDLSALGFISKLVLIVGSSDVGQYGINTPTYVCIDNIKGQLIPEE